MIDRIKREPVLVVALLEAVLALTLAFGLALSVEQVGAIMALAAAVLAIFVRGAVTPAVKYVPQHKA